MSAPNIPIPIRNVPAVRKNDLNAPDNTNAILRLEVELRDKNQPLKKNAKNKAKQVLNKNLNFDNIPNVDIPMEKVSFSCNFPSSDISERHQKNSITFRFILLLDSR